MTMKTKKTLQHIAAVAVVLLTLCLVFAAPVSAEGDVAKIGDTGYATLAEAIGAAENGDTITLLKDVNLGDGTNDIIINDKGITINADSEKKITLTSPSVFVVSGTGTLTLDKNIIVNSSGCILYISENGEAIIEGAILNGGLTQNTVTVWVNNGGNLTVKSGSITSKESTALDVDGTNSCAAISGGEIKTDKENPAFCAAYSHNGGKIIMTDGTVSAKAGRGLNAASGGEIEVSGGTINGGVLAYDATTSKAVINGGTINGVVGAYNGGSMTITGGSFTDIVNATKFAADKAVIKLAEDVTSSSRIVVDKSITIDGNGHTFTRTGGNTGLYLKNSSEGVEKITVTLQNLNVVATHYPVYIGSKVDLTIKDGSKFSGYSAIYLTNYTADDDASGSKVTILNSELIGENSANEGTSSNFGTIAIQANNTEVDVQNSKLVAKATGTANQSILRFGADSATSPFENAKVTIGGNSVLEVSDANFMSVGTGSDFTGISQQIIGAGVTANFNPSAYIASGMEVVQPGDKYLVQKYVDRSSSSSSSSTTEPEEPEQPEEPVVEPETPAAPGEVASSTEVTDGGEVAFETTVVDDETGEQSAPAAADDEVKGVVLPTGTEGTVEFVPVSEQPAPAGQEENTKRVFEINVPSYKKGEASVIKFQMTVAEIEADGKTAADVALWHYDEETGEWTKLVTSFIIKDGIVYFEAITNDFSPFAIVYADEPAEELPTDTPETPEQPEEPASPAPVLAVLAALGAAVVLRRK